MLQLLQKLHLMKSREPVASVAGWVLCCALLLIRRKSLTSPAWSKDIMDNFNVSQVVNFEIETKINKRYIF